MSKHCSRRVWQLLPFVVAGCAPHVTRFVPPEPVPQEGPATYLASISKSNWVWQQSTLASLLPGMRCASSVAIKRISLEASVTCLIAFSCRRWRAGCIVRHMAAVLHYQYGSCVVVRRAAVRAPAEQGSCLPDLSG